MLRLLKNEEIKSVLKGAAGILKQGWTQRVYARDEAGTMEDVHGGAACKWCVYGAIRKSMYDLELVRSTTDTTWMQVADVLDSKLPDWESASVWNDHPSRTQEEVVQFVEELANSL